MTFHMSYIYGTSYFHEHFLHETLNDSEAYKHFDKYYTDVLSLNYEQS